MDKLKEQYLGVYKEIPNRSIGSVNIEDYLFYDWGTFDFDVYLPSIGKNLQREFVWTLEQKQELIRSVILGRKIPEVAVVKHTDKQGLSTIQVIDGKQRLSTLMSFIKGEFSVDGYFYEDFNGGKEFRTALNINAKIYYSHHDDLITDEQKVQLFKMVNFSGTPQEAEHFQGL